MTRETLDLKGIELPQIQSRKPAKKKKPYLPFNASKTDPVPPFLPIGAKQPVRQTSSTHGPDGFITIDSKTIALNQARLMRKIEDAVENLVIYESYHAPAARVLIITYGISARAAKSALFENDDQPYASLLILKTLWPVPEEIIRKEAAAVDRIVVVEMNMGQYVREIQRVLIGKKVEFLGRMDGELIRPRQIIEVIGYG